MSAMPGLFHRAFPLNTVSGGRRYLLQSTRTNVIHHELKQQPVRARQVSSLSPTLLLLGFMPVFTFGLGIWQIQRLKWKVNLIDELTQTLQKPALLLPNTVDLSAIPTLAYRKVVMSGFWDHEHSIRLGPRTYEGKQGFHLVTPLHRRDGSTVLVDRGFVPEEFYDKYFKQEQPAEEVMVYGMVKIPPGRNLFTPDNNPEKGDWYWLDTRALASHAGGDAVGVQPILIEEIFQGHSGDIQFRLNQGVPIGRMPSVELRNQHATYALTWFSLSAMTALLFVGLLRKRTKSNAVRLPR